MFFEVFSVPKKVRLEKTHSLDESACHAALIPIRSIRRHAPIKNEMKLLIRRLLERDFENHAAAPHILRVDIEPPAKFRGDDPADG